MGNIDLFDAVIAAAGNSIRMGADKVLLPVGNDSVLLRTVSVFYNHPKINRIVLVIKKNDFDSAFSIIKALDTERFRIVEGGDSRAESVEKGLSYCVCEGVLIHDGARPFVSPKLIDSVIESVLRHGSGVPALPLPDSVRKVDNGVITGIEDREKMRIVQTPQGFLLNEIKAAYSLRGKELFTDDSEIYARFIKPPAVVNGEERNIKITTLGNYFGLNSNIGIGYDIHRLVPFRKLILGGIEIASEKGALAHSDGDAVIHALIDALLSAAGQRDIGCRFPDTDPAYRDIDSTILLSGVMEIYNAKNFKISNVSVTVIIDKPKLADYIPLMALKLSNILGIPKEAVAIAAKTTEGTSETVSAYAAVIIT